MWRNAILYLLFAIGASACSSDPGLSPGSPTAPFVDDVPAFDDTPAFPSGPDLSPGSATAPFVDGVPAFRKAGITVVSGFDYEPLYNSSLMQEAVRLTMTAERGAFGFIPADTVAPSDHIQLGAVDGAAKAWPFVVTDADEFRVFVDPESPGDCSTIVQNDAPFQPFGINGDVDGNFAVTEASCVERQIEGEFTVGSLAGLNGSPRAFGVLLTADQRRSTITLDWLSLGNSSEIKAADMMRVDVVGREHLISVRTADPNDDGATLILHVLRNDGSKIEIESEDDGSFKLPRYELGDRAKVWVEDYGTEHYAAQGPWLDPSRLTANLVIDASPSFIPTGEKPEPSDNHRRPHELSWWNGRRGMDSQEFAGRNWNNNLGFPDRDRAVDNPNGCHRAAWFGGSYIAASQTRVDQKPGLIAEALLDTQGEGCFEVITLGQSLFTVENHAGNARRMVEDYGVTQLIFSISSNELCRMHDEVYSFVHGVAPDTPVHWRFFEGEFIEPELRRNAVEIDPPTSFQVRDLCSFDPQSPAFGGAKAAVAKLGAMGAEMETWDDAIEITFLITKDVLADNSERAAIILELCLATGHDCMVLPTFEHRLKPDELAAIDFNPFLTRYKDDGHPNETANQHIADALVEAVAGNAARVSG